MSFRLIGGYTYHYHVYKYFKVNYHNHTLLYIIMFRISYFEVGTFDNIDLTDRIETVVPFDRGV